MILAIDTSGSTCGLALWQNGPIGVRLVQEGLRHNEVLFDQMNFLFAEHQIQGNSLSAVAVSSGPGSFTGLRVGMAAAKGLCWSWKLPLICVPTLEGLAEAAPSRFKRTLALMPARAKEVYCALFEYCSGKWMRRSEDQVHDVSRLGAVYRDEVFLCGEGYSKHQSELDSIFAGRRLELTENERMDALVVSTARLAARRLERKQFDDLMRTEPIYCYSFPRREP